MNDLHIRPGTPDELDTVESLLRGASAWLASRGIDQWQYPPHRDRISAALEQGVCFIAFADDAPVATLQLDEFADPEFWTPDDEPAAALYLHRMAVRRDAAGANIGVRLLEWAAGQAAFRGKKWLRLDAWKDNAGLHGYYSAAGFELLRTVDLPHRKSGALFQRPVGQLPTAGR